MRIKATQTFMYRGKEVETPSWGEFVGGGFNKVVISYTHKHDGEEGWRPNGVVLAKSSGGMAEVEYVVWNCYYDGIRWNCESGDYYVSIIEAAHQYELRGGK